MNFPRPWTTQILRSEEIVLVLHENHPLAAKAITRPGFRYPWLDLSLLKEENFILLYPDQNTGGISLDLFQEYNINPPVSLHTRNSSMSIHLAMDASALPSPRRATSIMKTSTPETAPSASPSATDRPSQLPSPPIGKTGICRSMQEIF